MIADRHGQGWIAGSAALFAAAAIGLPFVGPSPLDLGQLLDRRSTDWSILVHLRLSRTLLGLFAGAALGLAGSLFQTMLRDTLATPYTLGVSTGASLGAVVAIGVNWYVIGVWGVWLGALIGAAAVLFLVAGAASWQRDPSALTLLLAGVAINSICSALILLVLGLSSVSQTFSIARWLIGSLDAIAYGPLAVFIAVVVLLGAAVIRRGREWNLLAVGEAWAGTRGADVRGLLVFGYVAGSVLSALTVAVTGPIGFIGLVVPHLVRIRVSADDRVLMPCAFLLGGVFLASCDAVGRVLLAPAEIPAGAITACVGGPYLVWLVRQRA